MPRLQKTLINIYILTMYGFLENTCNYIENSKNLLTKDKKVNYTLKSIK